MVFEKDSICESIGIAAFSCNYDLIEITLPSNLKIIDQDAFSGCTSLKEILSRSIIE